MEKKGRNCSIILSWMALAISLITIALFFVKVTPNSIVDSNTFVAVLASFIGISVTLLIGYQVYNAVEIKQELSKIGILKDELDKAKIELDHQKQEVEEKGEKLLNKMEIIRCVCLSRAESVDNPVMAFIKLHEALRYILSSDCVQNELVWYKEELEERMQRIDKACFGLDVVSGIQLLKSSYIEDLDGVKSHENYYIVKDWYEELMYRFEKVLENIIKEAGDETVEPYSSIQI